MMNKLSLATDYQGTDSVIDAHHPAVKAQAMQLGRGTSDISERAQRCFHFVRDQIDHSFDINAKPVTCSASEVLLAGHGICYAKSHLLAALLRASGIPAGFGYQRLDDDQGGNCLHGYNWVQLPQYGWYRIDARGNTGDIEARFCPPQERLAFAIRSTGECDYNLNLAAPHASVVRALNQAGSVAQLRRHLPRTIHMG